MDESKALVPVEQREVLFYEDTVTAVAVQAGDRRRIYVPLRPICDRLGIDWSAQRQRINRDPVLSEEMRGVVVTPTPPADKYANPQEMSCLPLEYLNGWLFGVSANRVKEEVRDRLVRYQKECFQVLYEAFQEGRLSTEPDFDLLLKQDSEAVQAYQIALAVYKLARSQVQLEARLDSQAKELTTIGQRLDSLEAELSGGEQNVTEEQASQVSQAVKAVALAQGSKTKRNEFGAVYGELYRRFGITSYKMLPRKKFADAMAFLTEWHQRLTGDAPF